MDVIGHITLTGVQDLLKDIDKYDKRIQTLVASEVKASAQKITRDAKRNAPKDQGRLGLGITYKPVNGLTYEIISDSEYSAFAEFGTGNKTRIDYPELFEYAKKFKGQTLAEGAFGFKQAIFEWAKRKGIEKKYWYPILKEIYLHGTRPHSFFFPAYYAEIPLLRKRIERIVNTTT